ncbi:galactose-1-phosphate uridylyltransferase [Nocardiaceae bacterium YC2-7]|uniref:Galactose-1-phosphate uridylyltransferase n=1 Tax=Antrihabitans stalactiti TaxID=2584121 RepID=A0A848KAT5_9NOCA|nr:galactose-1-phosphate uridylyltransferase [Antrihabitans stalactiti]
MAAQWAKTVRALADGREIRYYDSELRERSATDTRDLAPVESRSHTTLDALTGEWITHATHRQTRTFLPSTDLCPLCPSVSGRATEIPEPDYEVVVFDNRFSAFAGGPGHCDVVCFTSAHDTTFAALGLARARMVVDVWADRTADLTARDGVAQVFCFENHGEEIGVTLSHPHGQIYAYPFITPRAEKILVSADRHRRETGRDLFEDVLARERDDENRIVATNDEWLAFVPVAARWPFEVQLFPRRRVADIPDLDDSQRDGFADLYLDMLQRFAALFDESMPYIAAWNQAPATHRDAWWLHMQLFSIRRAPGKLKYLAGSESAMGAFINDTDPAAVAAQLRAAR